MMATAEHLVAFSSMLADDQETGSLHTRDLQIIAFLVAQRAPMPVGQVAAMLDISSSHVSRVTDKLVLRGLLARKESPSDRRIALLEPTPAGRALDTRVQGYYATSRTTKAPRARKA